MAITKPPVLPAWAESGDRVTPSNAEIQVGWPLSSIPPSRQRFNWLLNYLANAVRYFSRRGIPDYDAAETYMIGDRIIGDDGKTYRSLIDTNIAQTPSTSPTKWERWALTLAEMYTSLTTPAQFDNSVKPSTTAFVQRALGNFSGGSTYGVNTTLTAADMGQWKSVISAGVTLTLPLLSTVAQGSVLSFYGNGIGLTVARQGTDSVVLGSSGALTSVVVGAFDTLTFIAFGTSWYPVGGSSQLVASSAFAASLASNGYEKSPSGKIEQWGSVAVPAGGSATFTYPIAFPTAAYNVQATAIDTVAVEDYRVSTGTPGLNSVTIYNSASNPVTVYVRVNGK